MHKVEATITPSRLEDISNELKEIGIKGMTVCGENNSRAAGERVGAEPGTKAPEEAQQNLQIDIVVEESLVARVLAVLARHANAFPFVFLNYQGIGSSSTNPQWQEPHVISESTLPLKCPPEPAF